MFLNLRKAYVTLRTSNQTSLSPYEGVGRGGVGLIALSLLVTLTLINAVRSLAQTPTVTDLFSFTAPLGSYPNAPLIQGSDGYFYGTTSGGGLGGGYGTVFRMTSAANIMALHHFTGADGAYPAGSLAQGNDGNFYGATTQGGANNTGTLFKMAPDGTLTTLYNFSAISSYPYSNADGSAPNGGLVQASDGSFYGTTQYGGAYGYGTAFKIAPDGTFTPLHYFAGLGGANGPEGTNPTAGLVQGSDGYFYGTTAYGGAFNYGTVYRMAPDGTVFSLHSFTGTTGENPQAPLVQGSDGNFYGTTPFDSNNYGTVFQITPDGVLTTLHYFTPANTGTDGAFPYAGLARGSDGNFYGMTTQGGSGGYGTVFQITPFGALSTLYSFGGVEGYEPYNGLIQGSDGNLYGTTTGSAFIAPGLSGYGTVFAMTTGGALLSWYAFQYPDGANPWAAVLQASDGNLYGTTSLGGAYGDGSVFALSLGGSFNSLYSFFGGPDSAIPVAGLIQASDGNLYGSTEGLLDAGSLFSIPPGGTSLNLLYDFSGPDGSAPRGTLLQASDGNFYGTTLGGGTNYTGTVFQFTPSGTLTTLYTFSATSYSYPWTNADGAYPSAGLVQASDGNLYGTTSSGGAYGYGTVFRITLGGALTTLYTFTGGADGAGPSGKLIQASDGNLYGTTGSTVFQMTLGGTLTTLHTLSTSEGSGISSGLLQASDGNLYGTAAYGGANNNGTLFRITLGGTFTLLYSFSGYEGQYPLASLIEASDGALYGTTQYGGQGGAGVVYRLTSLYPVPSLTSLSPASKDAGAPSFTLTLKGTGFQPFSRVYFNGTPVATTYVSVTALKASIPAALISTPGAVPVTVFTPTGGGASNVRTFKILLTTLKLASATLTRNSAGNYVAKISLKNVGYLTAPNVQITKATLGSASSGTKLPLTLGNIAKGAIGTTSLTFPHTAGAAGTVVTLKVSGTFTGGSFSGSLKVTLP